MQTSFSWLVEQTALWDCQLLILKTEAERRLSYLLLHTSNAHSSQGWTRLNPGSQHLAQASHEGKARTQHSVSILCLPGTHEQEFESQVEKWTQIRDSAHTPNELS